MQHKPDLSRAATWTRVAAWTATGMQTRTQRPDDLCFDGGLDDDLSSDTGDLSFLEEALVLRVDGFDGLVFLNACTEALRDETAVVAAPLPAAASAACPPWSLSTVCSLATTRQQVFRNEVGIKKLHCSAYFTTASSSMK
ncbi:hypothetical protein Pcac1_g6508 [Phytophthora cactorum]|nr:hypothetical protein Pcac1_g6508 [Phytophthora cactorum]KAG2846614.1 hypothetical protein PC111_g1125 [Phytophthora cactorum]